jgi:hypothetical protein
MITNILDKEGTLVVTLSDLIRLSKLAVSLKDKILSKPEKELLVKAEENEGEIQILKSNQTGEFIRIGHSDFIDENDPSKAAVYFEALEKLIKRGLAEHKRGVLFCLTGSGFGKARKLKPKR